jgi:uncharacterized protein (DUF779 family)/nucleotide-binding universal stress UspA family protein
MRDRVLATPEALEVLERLTARHGALIIHQSGGCCDGSSPVCVAADELPPGPDDVQIGEIASTPVFIDSDQDVRWGRPTIVVDVAPGPATGLSLEGADGLHFVTRAPERSRTVVVGYDDSESARRALDWALERAGHGGRVVVVDAIRRQPDALARPSVEAMLHDRALEGHANDDLVFLDHADVIGPELEGEVVDAVPSAALLQAERDHDADEIVVGHRDRGRLRSMSGSVSAALLRDEQRPVVVVVP